MDGVKIEDADPVWLRKMMGLVSQEPVLFDGSIRFNIAYGNGGTLGEAKMIEVAEAANAHAFISGFPDGYGTLVGERGVTIVGRAMRSFSRALPRNKFISGSPCKPNIKGGGGGEKEF